MHHVHKKQQPHHTSVGARGVGGAAGPDPAGREYPRPDAAASAPYLASALAPAARYDDAEDFRSNPFANRPCAAPENRPSSNAPSILSSLATSRLVLVLFAETATTSTANATAAAVKCSAAASIDK